MNASYRLLFGLLILISLGCRQESVQVAEQEAATLPAMESSDDHPLQAFKEKNDDPIAAAADRFQRRLSADGTVPHRALLNAKAQRDAMVLQQQSGLVADNAGWPSDWQWVGPGNIGGRLRPIIFDPAVPTTMYVGSASGGIWKTVDGGSNWLPLDDFLPSLSVSDLVMHPEDSNTIFAATGEGFFEAPEGSSNTAAVRGAGIFFTTDAGVTWSPTIINRQSGFLLRESSGI